VSDRLPGDVSADAATTSPSVAVVVPAHRASPEFRACLDAFAACDPRPDELVVVVDGADEDTAEVARRVADRVLPLPDAAGPARARNRGAATTRTEVVFFVDSDVVVPADVVAQVRRAFAARPTTDAIIGSYDDRPPAPGLASQYKNLLNHHVHQTTATEGSTFWGACGAIRREAFDRIGGFDERYTRPCIEDIELGHRLRDAGGRIEVVPDLQVTHLKRWTPRGLVAADVFDRAVPWSELIVAGHGFREELNISRVQRLKAVLASLALLGTAAAAWSRPSRRLAVATVAALAVLDLPLLRFFAAKRGVPFAVGAAGWHWLSYVYSAAAFAGVVLRRLLPGRSGTSGDP
jgi:glycosyltransferase involved in cell wall biosynthesis